MSGSGSLSAKRQRFVDEYLVDLNATRAAVRAGYSRKTAEQQGYRLLRNVQVARAIARGQAEVADKSSVTRERVLGELELLAFSNVMHYLVDDDGNVKLAPGAPAGAERALQSVKRRVTVTGSGDNVRRVVEVEVKLWDKPGPLKLAGRHVGLFPDRLEVSATAAQVLTFSLNLDGDGGAQ